MCLIHAASRLTSAALQDRQVELVLPALVKQLEIVDSVDLPERVKKFFRTVPIVLNPESNAEYTQLDGKWVVSIRTDSALPESKPMVLHELLHALHHQVLKQPTPEIAPRPITKRCSGTYTLQSMRRRISLITGRNILRSLARSFSSGQSSNRHTIASSR